MTTTAHQLSAQALSNTSGSQGEIRKLVLDFVRYSPEPVTALEVSTALAPKLSVASHGNLNTRVYELHAGDALEKAGTRRCRVSGQVATVYRATGRPYQPKKKTTPSNTRAQGIHEAISYASELRSLRPEWTDALTTLIEGLNAVA